MKNVQLKLLVAFLIVFSCTLLFHIRESQAIYKEVKSSTISLSVVDSTSSHTVTLDARNGSTTTVSVIHNGTIGSALYTPTRTNYNFMGWYDSNNQRIYADKQITGNVTFHAEWTKIVCKKVTDVNNLNTEECLGSAGCVTSGVGYTAHSTITYGTIFGENSPKAGDAYDCDVYYNPNEDTFDEVDTYGKHIERFYFVRDKENNGSEDTAVLIYYTSFDGNGRVDTQNTDKNNIGSGHYDVAMTWLPTSSTWANPGLINFGSGTGTISRFLSVADLTTVCGPLNNNGTANTNYFINCLGGTKQNWFLFENSRFQASSLGRAGIWLETDGIRFYRIQTGSIAVGTFTLGTNSDNMARPVIEIPMSALEGFVNANRYTITFETHGGTPTISSVRRYEGETIGEIPTVTLEHNTFDGWYQTYTNGEYSNPAGTSTVVHSDLTLHAKWVAKSTCTVNLVLNGGTGLDTPVVVDVGDLYVPGTPTKDDNTFVGWFTDSEMTVSYDSTVPISGSSLTLYAKWASVNYVADVAGVGQFES
ncbi:MAG: InlB B-repeat-containing protein, partial [Bacilli bacterium]|nr:InlB B-repeat-containing protein [Bacilli bacterium]